MTDRLIKCPVITFAMILLFTGCGSTIEKKDIIGRTYAYEKDGFGGPFIITISDGAFSYYEGALSSYIGSGEWKLQGNTLILSDDAQMGYPLVNYFKVDGDSLIFLSERSSNFLYVQVMDSDRFTADPAGSSVE